MGQRPAGVRGVRRLGHRQARKHPRPGDPPGRPEPFAAKVRHTNRADWFEALFHDSPNLQALDLFDLGLWNEAADGLALADRRTPHDAWRSYIRMRSLLAAGRDGEYRRGFAEMIHRFDQTGVEQTPTELVMACYLPPEKSPDRDRWVQRWEKQVERNAKAWHEYQYLANAYFRAARFAEAERALRQAIELDDNVQTAVLWASTAFFLGRTDEARTRLRAVEQRDSRMVQRPEGQNAPAPLPRAEGQANFVTLLREAQTLIAGRDPGVDPNEPACGPGPRNGSGSSTGPRTTSPGS